MPDGRKAFARLAGTRLGQQRIVEILPKLFMLPQVNDGGRLLAAFVHHESDSAHGNKLTTKVKENQFNFHL
jgi:3-deoxy-D-arabino-heptulosonate 7-phosphate (DAHP) synthase class II